MPNVPAVCQLCDCDVRSADVNLTSEHQGKIVDGRVRGLGWAWMCWACFTAQGVGLGVGCGQLYDVATGKKLEG